MPLYTFACSECDRRVDLFLAVERRHDTYSCGCPDGTIHRVFTAPNLRGETVART